MPKTKAKCEAAHNYIKGLPEVFGGPPEKGQRLQKCPDWICWTCGLVQPGGFKGKPVAGLKVGPILEVCDHCLESMRPFEVMLLCRFKLIEQRLAGGPRDAD
jgi:hypothetical protein